MTRTTQIILLLIESVLVCSYAGNFTDRCESPDNLPSPWRIRAGESLYLRCPNVHVRDHIHECERLAWFRNLSRTKQLEPIGMEESERVHYHGSVLYILHLTLNDTGRYIIRCWYEKDNCEEFEKDVVVYEEFSRDLLVLTPPEQALSGIFCSVCEDRQNSSSFIWYKNFSLIPNKSGNILRIRNASKESEGIYTCVCTWEHHGIKYNTSGSREQIIQEKTSNIPPQFRLPINNSIVITDVGAEVALNCSVYSGVSLCRKCSVHWERNRIRLDRVDGYKEERRQKDGSLESVLTISKVSELDLRSEFRCKVTDESKVIFVSVTLKSRASMLPVFLACMSIFLVLLVFGGTVKWFALDLVLFLRVIYSKFNRKEDGKLYDAYVIYQRNNLDETTDETVSEFVKGSLLTVLESYCGFKLFIHGRDDLPGEDSANLIETKIKLSRRLIVILTSSDTFCVSPEAYDLQVGLHQALVQGDTGVIVIQLEQMQDCTHLPLGLQHLLRKNPPIVWRDGESSPSSRFWKRVRYRMPVPSSSSSSSSSSSFWWSSSKSQHSLV